MFFFKYSVLKLFLYYFPALQVEGWWFESGSTNHLFYLSNHARKPRAVHGDEWHPFKGFWGTSFSKKQKFILMPRLVGGEIHCRVIFLP